MEQAAPTPDRLDDLLSRCDRQELLTLATFAGDLSEPSKDAEKLSDGDLRIRVTRELRYRGSSDAAYYARALIRGQERAGIPYESLLEDLMQHLSIHPSIQKRVGMELGDHVYARELLITLAYTYSAGNAGSAVPGDLRATAIFSAGLGLVRGASAYPALVKAAADAATAVGGRSMAAALNAVLGRSAGFILGPASWALTAYTAARAVYSIQAPNHRVCTATVAILGSLRLKYFPLTADQFTRIERFLGTLQQECVACGKALGPKDGACLLCWTAMHAACGTEVKRLDTAEKGRVCAACQKQDLAGEGLLVPAAGALSMPEVVYSAGYRLHVLDQGIRRAAQTVEMALGQTAQEAHKLREDTQREIQQLRQDLVKDLHEMVRKAFGYLWVMLFSTIFLTLVGIAYYQSTASSPGKLFSPGAFFRFSLLLMIVLPAVIWFIGALARAGTNRKREEYEKRPDGRRLELRDYLFGFLYYNSPVENVWGPVALIGFMLASVLAMILFG